GLLNWEIAIVGVARREWRLGGVEGRKVGRMEEWKDGRVEEWTIDDVRWTVAGGLQAPQHGMVFVKTGINLTSGLILSILDI
ncbi:MAG: hypothetical protein P8Y03_28455, partial [Anaerolineales bacterium]